MDPRIRAWIDRVDLLRMITESLQSEVAFFLEQARAAPFPSKVRLAVAADIVVGAVIWYLEDIHDNFRLVTKAEGHFFMDHTGLFVTIDDAFVEVEDE